MSNICEEPSLYPVIQNRFKCFHAFTVRLLRRWGVIFIHVVEFVMSFDFNVSPTLALALSLLKPDWTLTTSPFLYYVKTYQVQNLLAQWWLA